MNLQYNWVLYLWIVTYWFLSIPMIFNKQDRHKRNDFLALLISQIW